MNPTIPRPIVTGDIAALQALDGIAHGSAWSSRTFSDEIGRHDRIHLVLEDAGAPIAHAAAWIDGPSCRITNVAVAPADRGKGHAATLLLAVLRRALECRSVTNVQLEVRPANRRAQRLYLRFGFVPVAVERDFYDRRDESGSTDALVMVVADVCDASWRERLDALETEVGAAA